MQEVESSVDEGDLVCGDEGEGEGGRECEEEVGWVRGGEGVGVEGVEVEREEGEGEMGQTGSAGSRILVMVDIIIPGPGYSE